MDWTAVVIALAGGTGIGCLTRWASEHSHQPAPLRKGSCELGTAVVWAGLVGCLSMSGTSAWWMPIPLAVAALAVPLTLSDLRYRRLPDTLTLPAYPVFGTAVVVAVIGGSGPGVGLRAVVAALIFGGLHAAVRFAAPAAMGAGDVKLAGSLGGVLGASGWAALPVAAGVAAISSVVLACVMALANRGTRRHGVPHGPGLLVGTLLASSFAGGV